MKSTNRTNRTNKKNSGTIRKSKKQVYLEHGIIYDNGRILTPIGWVRELMKKGNTKTGVTVYTFSTLPGTAFYTATVNGIEYTVKGTCICDCEGCYATAGHYHRKTVIRSMLINTYLVNNYLKFVKRALSAQIQCLGRVEIRIHAAGDFNTVNSEEYANMWHDVIKKYSVKLYDGWTYTKIKKYEPLFDDIKNANIVKSVIPGVGVNFGHCDYIISTYKLLKRLGKSVYICLCGIDKDKTCEQCSVCATYEYVLFIEHSTNYKAEEDPLYDELCRLAREQLAA